MSVDGPAEEDRRVRLAERDLAGHLVTLGKAQGERPLLEVETTRHEHQPELGLVVHEAPGLVDQVHTPVLRDAVGGELDLLGQLQRETLDRSDRDARPRASPVVACTEPSYRPAVIP